MTLLAAIDLAAQQSYRSFIVFLENLLFNCVLFIVYAMNKTQLKIKVSKFKYLLATAPPPFNCHHPDYCHGHPLYHLIFYQKAASFHQRRACHQSMILLCHILFESHPYKLYRHLANQSINQSLQFILPT